MRSVLLNPGDRVAFLDEVGGGVLLRITRPGHAMVRGDDGFELEHRLDRLVPGVKDAEQVLHRIKDHQLGMVAANDRMAGKRRSRPSVRPGKTPKCAEDNSVAEVDLHLHEIIEDESRLTDGEKLEYQLRYFERALEAAIRDGKRKLIVIHGVGEGKLREEVRRILQFYDTVRFHDADMRRYGAGATEVQILRQ